MSDEPISFRFAAIQIISKSLAEIRPEKINKNLTTNFEIKVETRVKAELHLVIPYVIIKIKDGNDPESLADFTIACYFEIVDFDKFITLNDKGLYIVPVQLDSLLRPVSVSTARGVIYSELRGTYLQNIIMPVVFMSNFKIEPLSDTSLVGQVQN